LIRDLGFSSGTCSSFRAWSVSGI